MNEEPEGAAESGEGDEGQMPLPTPVVDGQQQNMGDWAPTPTEATPPPAEPAMPAAEPAMPAAEPVPVQPQMAYQQPQPQMYAPPPAYTPPSQPAAVTMSKALAMYIWLIALIGAILILIGEMMEAADNIDIRNAAATVASIGALITGVPMLIVGIYNEEAKDQVRFGLILGGALLLLAMALF